MSRNSLRAAVTALVAIASWAATGQPASAVPTLSGTYVFTNFENCGSGLLAQATGTVAFNLATKTFTQKGLKIVGAPLNEQTISASGNYANGATTLTFSAGGGSSTYNVYYGASAGGIATYFTGILLVSGPCGYLLTMTRQ